MVLEFIFSFLLNYPPAFSVFIFSFIILFVINIFYKVLVNQQEARQLKERTKELSSEMKEAQKAGDSDRSKKLMSDLMKENSKMMRMTMKPMIVSLVIVVILLPSLGSFYGDKTVTEDSVTLGGTDYQVSRQDSSVTIGSAACNIPCKVEIDGVSYKVSADGTNLKVAQIIAVTPVSLPLVGNSFGWLGWYIICSLPLAILMRKLMKIYM